METKRDRLKSIHSLGGSHKKKGGKNIGSQREKKYKQNIQCVVKTQIKQKRQECGGRQFKHGSTPSFD